jgi:hypothetical protein
VRAGLQTSVAAMDNASSRLADSAMTKLGSARGTTFAL